MRVTKYYCDRCKKEISFVNDVEIKAHDNCKMYPPKRLELCDECFFRLHDEWMEKEEETEDINNLIGEGVEI